MRKHSKRYGQDYSSVVGQVAQVDSLAQSLANEYLQSQAIIDRVAGVDRSRFYYGYDRQAYVILWESA